MKSLCVEIAEAYQIERDNARGSAGMSDTKLTMAEIEKIRAQEVKAMSKDTFRKDVVDLCAQLLRREKDVADLMDALRTIGKELSYQWGSAEEGDLSVGQMECFTLLDEFVPIDAPIRRLREGG